MDLSTILGLVVGFGFVMGSIITGGSALIFLNVPSALVVVGGTIATCFIRYPFADVFNTVGVVKNAFLAKLRPADEVIKEFVELSMVSRKEGLLALESMEFDDPFMAKAVNACVDGAELNVISAMLHKELEYSQKRHKTGIQFFKDVGDAAPAFGMIGTLIGLVQMLSNMSDPKSIGPSMAVAILTTLYGAVIANVFALPLADKLKLRNDEETRLRMMVIEGTLGLKRGANPRMLEESLQSFMAPKSRADRKEAA